MRIIVDVDLTVGNYIEATLALEEKFTGTKIDREKRVLEWDWHQKGDPALKEFISAEMDKPNFWLTMPLIPDAKEGVAYLRSQGHQLIWCTKPRESCIGWADYRRQWIDNNFQFRSFNEPYVPTEDKWLIQASVMIDDYVPYVEKWEKHNKNGIAFVFASPLNKEYQGPRHNWKDIMSMPFFRNKER